MIFIEWIKKWCFWLGESNCVCLNLECLVVIVCGRLVGVVYVWFRIKKNCKKGCRKIDMVIYCILYIVFIF